jgi:hypothetical protein
VRYDALRVLFALKSDDPYASASLEEPKLQLEHDHVASAQGQGQRP